MPTPNKPPAVEVSPTEPGHSMPPPSPGPLRIDAISPSELRVYWIGQPLADNYRVQRAQSPNGPWTTIATPPGSASNIEDTGLDEDTTYHYRVRAENAWGASAWAADSATTSPETLLASPASPGAVSVEPASDPGVIKPGVRASPTEPAASEASVNSDVGVINPEPVLASPSQPATVAATPNDIGEFEFEGDQQYRIEYRTSDTGTGAGPWQDAGTYWGYERPVLLDLLPSGTTLDVRVIAVTEHTESPGPVETFQTLLPPLDASDLTLGTGLEGTITVSWPDVLDTGEYDIQIREASADGWGPDAAGFVERTLPAGSSETTFTGLPDGEEYAVRVRLATGSRVSAWTEPRTVTTQFSGLTSLTVEGSDETSVSFKFTDQTDNEAGVRVYRRRQYESGLGERVLVETIGPFGGTGTVNYTDTTARPDNEYVYEFEMFTDDTSVSKSVTATTQPLGIQQRPVESRGWDIGVERSDGRHARPEIVGDPKWLPKTNELPRVRVPVEKSPRWDASEYEKMPMRVWKDGRLLAAEELENVHEKEDHVVLEGRGGLELLRRARVSYNDKRVHDAARDLVQNKTSYGTNVDDPAASTQQDAVVQEPSTTNDFLNAVESQAAEDEPMVLRNGRVDFHQSAKFVEAENADQTTPEPSANSELSNGEGVSLFAAGQDAEHTFTTDYDWSGGNWEIGLYLYIPNGHGGTEPGIEVEIDGSLVLDQNGNNWLGSSFDGDHYWFTETVPFDLSAGDHTMTITVTSDSDTGDNIWLDGFGMMDERYTPNAPAPAPSPSTTDWPPLYPQGYAVEFKDVTTAREIESVEFDGEFNDTSGLQQIELSPDGGANYTVSASNSSTASGSFSQTTTSVKAKVTFDAWGLRSSPSPTADFNAQTLSAFTLSADLSDTPIVGNQSYDNTVLSVLQRLAEFGNFVFEVQRKDGDITVEWTQPGQRDGELEGTVGRYKKEKNFENSYGRVVVKGTGLRRRSESFQSDHGVSVSLQNEFVIKGSEVVYDPQSGEQFEGGDDYTIDYSTGEIMTLSNGAMSDATQYEVDYRYKASGSYTAPSAATDPRTKVVEIPDLTTAQTCEQAALYVGKKVQKPLYRATVTIDSIDPSTSLVANLSLPGEADVDGTLVPSKVQNQTLQTELKLGTREEIDDIIERMKTTLSTAAQQV